MAGVPAYGPPAFPEPTTLQWVELGARPFQPRRHTETPSHPGAVDIHAAPGGSCKGEDSEPTALNGSLGSVFSAEPYPSIK